MSDGPQIVHAAAAVTIPAKAVETSVIVPIASAKNSRENHFLMHKLVNKSTTNIVSEESESKETMGVCTKKSALIIMVIIITFSFRPHNNYRTTPTVSVVFLLESSKRGLEV